MTESKAYEVDDTLLPGPHGTVPLRIYRPTGAPRGGLVWLHGGAFIGGDLDMPESDWVARQAAAARYTVVAVDYRLAPIPDSLRAHIPEERGQSRFPVASEEVAHAFRALGALDARVGDRHWALGGASAGANLAAGVTLRLRDEGGPMPFAVALAYPLVHAALPEMAAELRSKYDSLPVQERFSPESVDQLNLNYVGDPELLSHPYAFAGGADLSQFPPALIVNSDVDSLRASGDAFGAELIAAGIDITVVREHDTRHGHLNDPDDAAAQRSIRRIVDWLDYRRSTL